jgi:hypothetical protein
MWEVVIVILLAGLLVHVLTRKTKRKELPNETYICDVCGDKDCVCRKENGDG